uniref:Cytochrome c oxidase subunit 3 n=1 Tax=Saxidomus purpurata TaxID=311201 RepID=A0A0D4CGG7_9BIVA|nr:cytochrome c oxidase subunit III [Saxidomus purpurata]AJT47996.1 cytochrome c oxidase subunit III [Saxidomus purpurata]
MARTGYQLISPSPWPISTAFSVMGLCTSLFIFASEGLTSVFWGVCVFSIFFTAFNMCNWWSDVVMESTHLGEWSSYVLRTYVWGFRFFILSEAFFFASLFGSFIYASLGETSIQGVGFWPPRGIKPLHPGKVALLNTGVLVGSSLTANWALRCVKAHNLIPYGETFLVSSGLGNKEKRATSLSYQVEGLFSLGLTILLGVIFTYLQSQEYYWSSFSFADGICGSIFYLLTGFHGLHVIIGTIFLSVCWLRLYFLHFSYKHFYFGMWAAVWYWHFVDGIWIVVYFMVYVWGHWGYS